MTDLSATVGIYPYGTFDRAGSRKIPSDPPRSEGDRDAVLERRYAFSPRIRTLSTPRNSFCL